MILVVRRILRFPIGPFAAGLLAASVVLLPAASQPGRKPEAGSFLIASDHLLDPNFIQTVVLLLHYDEKGAMGVVVNRQAEVPLREVLPEVEGLEGRDDRLYLGGPVAVGATLFLAHTPQPPPRSKRILDDVFTVAGEEGLRRLLDDGTEERDLRVFAGYAGWAPGQLDAEIARGDWHLYRATPGFIFSPEPGKVWEELRRRALLPVI